MTFDELKLLNKHPDTNYEASTRYADIVAVYDYKKNSDDITERVLNSRVDGKYYYTYMKNGYLEKAFEIALDEDTGLTKTFSYTPDNNHLYNVVVRENFKYPIMTEYVKLVEIPDRYLVYHNQHYIVYIDDNTIAIDGKLIPVVNDYDNVYKLLKTRIKARDGAKGLMRFIDKTVEEDFGTCYIDRIIAHYTRR